MKLAVKDVSVSFHDGEKKVIQNISFEVKKNEFICIIGPNGCGKTTTLNVIAGFIRQQKGEIFLDGAKITKPVKEIGMIQQQNTLFPWKTVQQNILFGPELNNIPSHKKRQIASHYLKLSNLADYRDNYPNELSGGMKQMASIAMVLANNPKVILMDEPFKELDALNKQKFIKKLAKIWQKNKKTVLFVTHDIEEAIILSDRIIVMSKTGKIKKIMENTLPRPREFEKMQAKIIQKKQEIMEYLGS